MTALSWGEQGAGAQRGAYGEKLIAELDFPGKQTVVLLLRAGAFEPADGAAGEPRVERVELALGAAARTEHLELRDPPAGDVDITKADFLLSIGRGVEDEEQIAELEQLATQIGATLSASRPLVDAGWISSARQVGQSGRTVAPRVYLALGISGAVQHLAGIAKAQTIIAINSDPGGADLRRRSVRRRRRPVRGRRGARAAVHVVAALALAGFASAPASASAAIVPAPFASVESRPILWHMTVGLQVLWYTLAAISVLVFFYGLARPLCATAAAARAGPPPARELPRTRLAGDAHALLARLDLTARPLRRLGASRHLLRLGSRSRSARSSLGSRTTSRSLCSAPASTTAPSTSAARRC